jgi:hypothetical protein
MRPLLTVLLAAAGLAAGPLLRVVIVRLSVPPGEPWRRACPHCGAPVAWPWVRWAPAAGALSGRKSAEAREQGWGGEVAGLEVSIAAAGQKLQAMDQLAARHQVTNLGMPDFRPAAGRSSGAGDRP